LDKRAFKNYLKDMTMIKSPLIKCKLIFIIVSKMPKKSEVGRALINRRNKKREFVANSRHTTDFDQPKMVSVVD
jgi:hypothetical protein